MTGAAVFIIGARQTVDRARHPQLGEGRAVYEHGPAAFLADSGEVELLRDIAPGGAGTKHSSRGRYEHLIAHPVSGDPFELDTLDRAKGESHRRIVSPMVGPAWMVSVRGQKRKWIERVEPDSGAQHIVLEVRQAYVGLPPYNPRRNKQRGEDQHWMTMETDKGSFSYQREEYAGKASPEPSEDSEAKPKAKRSRKKVSKKKEPKPSAQARTLPLINEPEDVDETAAASDFCLAGFGMERACGTGKGSGSGVYTDDPTKVTCKKCLARMHERPQLVNWYKAQQRRTA